MLYSNPARLEQFLTAMTSISTGIGRALAQKFPWDRYQTVVDVGPPRAAYQCRSPSLILACGAAASTYPEYARSSRHMWPGLTSLTGCGSAPATSSPTSYHDWDITGKRTLLAKAYAALPTGGAPVIYEALIDDDRRTRSGAVSRFALTGEAALASRVRTLWRSLPIGHNLVATVSAG